MTPENTENNDSTELRTGSVTATHADSVTTTATELRANPTREAFSRLLVTYDTAISVLRSEHGPEEAFKLIETTEPEVQTALQTALSDSGFDIVRRDLYDSFDTHELYDAADSATLLTEALAQELLREATRGETASIPENAINYLLSQSNSKNKRARTAARTVGWAVAVTDATTLTRILDPRDGRQLDDESITEVLRHALHADQYAVADAIQQHMAVAPFEDAVQRFHSDSESGEVPIPEQVQVETAPETPDLPAQSLIERVDSSALKTLD